MARLTFGLTVLSSFRTVVLMMIQGGLLPLMLLAVTALAQRCTRAVPVHTYPPEKIKVLRRIPSTCSNWDKTWAWLTNKDCNTKYRMETMEAPPREVRQYKLQHYCCDGADKCEEADNSHSSGFNSTDAKFLAVVLGSTAACVVIVIIIFAITFYTKKSRCVLCDQDRHGYSSAGESSDPEDSRDDSPDVDKTYPADDRPGGGKGRCAREHSPCWESDTEQPEVKGTSEAVYAEIGDPGDGHLPRYADIFRGDGNPGKKAKVVGRPKRSKRDKNLHRDPFTNASAPPMYTEVSRDKKSTGPGRDKGRCTDAYVNAPNVVRTQPVHNSTFESAPKVDDPEIRTKQRIAQSSIQVSEDTSSQHNKQDLKSHPPHPFTQHRDDGRAQNDPKYYNVHEKKKKKRRTSSSSSCGTGSSNNRLESYASPSISNVAPSKGRGDTRRSKVSGTSETVMELAISKSSSVSDTVDKNGFECSETSLGITHKRLSAPPGSSVYENQNEVHLPETEQSQTTPQPPQSAAPPLPSSISNSSHGIEDTNDIDKTSTPCQFVLEAQAPQYDVKKEKKNKEKRKPSNVSSPLQPCISPGALATESCNFANDIKLQNNYENANLVTLSSDNSAKSQKGKLKFGIKQRRGLNSDQSISSLTANDHHHLEKEEEQVPLLSSSAASFEKEHSSAAIIDVSPEVIPGSSNSSPISQELLLVPSIETTKGLCESANAYDQLQFEDANKMTQDKPHSPNTHVYQSLETENVLADNDISYNEIKDTTNKNYKEKCELNGEISTESSEKLCSDVSKNCDSPPPPLLPPRCPITLNRHTVDGLSV